MRYYSLSSLNYLFNKFNFLGKYFSKKYIYWSIIELIFLSPKEISLELMKGSIDLGVTGLDLINEYVRLPDMNTHNILELGFGKADVVVAIPITWIDVMSINDLEDVIYNFRVSTGKRLRIATKYPVIYSKKCTVIQTEHDGRSVNDIESIIKNYETNYLKNI